MRLKLCDKSINQTLFSFIKVVKIKRIYFSFIHSFIHSFTSYLCDPSNLGGFWYWVRYPTLPNC